VFDYLRCGLPEVELGLARAVEELLLPDFGNDDQRGSQTVDEERRYRTLAGLDDVETSSRSTTNSDSPSVDSIWKGFAVLTLRSSRPPLSRQCSNTAQRIMPAWGYAL
jgi:hypothetical protein